MVLTGYNPVPGFIANPTGGYTAPPSYAGSPYGSQPPSTNTSPPGYTGETGRPGDPGYEATEVGRWSEYVEYLQQALAASSGFSRWQIERQLADAQKARDLQWKIAKLQSEGADNRLILQLKEQARQFDLNHGLEMQKLGLSRAQTATEYLATPDRYITGSRFLNLSARALSGQTGVAPYGTAGTPTPKTMEDFAVLQQGGNPGRALDPQAAASGGGGVGSDARVKALMGVIKALPPSSDQGLDPGDYAVLDVAKALYGSNLRPSQIAQFEADPESKGVLFDAGQNLGYNAKSWWQDQRRGLPGQTSVRSA